MRRLTVQQGLDSSRGIYPKACQQAQMPWGQLRVRGQPYSTVLHGTLELDSLSRTMCQVTMNSLDLARQETTEKRGAQMTEGSNRRGRAGADQRIVHAEETQGIPLGRGIGAKADQDRARAHQADKSAGAVRIIAVSPTNGPNLRLAMRSQKIEAEQVTRQS